MSFRELRSFTEVMKSLGYPRLISMENFRLPNFELVADCLYWLVHRYYPGVDMADEISTEADRVKFLQSAAQVMLTKARMKMNIKKLYAADGNAVKELLKIAMLLYKATQLTSTDADEDSTEAVAFTSGLQGFNPKDIKQNASEIIKSGAALYDALGQEPELREYRARAVAGHVDNDFIERSVLEAIAQVEDTVRSLENQMEDLERNEKTLDSKIDKKKQELERQEKRLSTLQSVRPAYMDEYERLQGELNLLYQQYLDRFRNLEFLENELETYYQAEQEKMEAQDRRLKKMQKRLKDEEMRILRGEQEVDETNMNFDDEEEQDDLFNDDEEEEDQQQARPVGKNTVRRADANNNFSPVRQSQGNGGGMGGSMGGSMGGAAAAGAGGGLVAGAVMGNLGGDFDDEASIDEDDNTDGGEVSMAGSEAGDPYTGFAPQAGYVPQGAMMGDDDGENFIQDDEEEDNDF